jgi:hypothetical protein
MECKQVLLLLLFDGVDIVDRIQEESQTNEQECQ